MRLKLHVGRECKEVVEMVCSRDVDMLGDVRL